MIPAPKPKYRFRNTKPEYLSLSPPLSLSLDLSLSPALSLTPPGPLAPPLSLTLQSRWTRLNPQHPIGRSNGPSPLGPTEYGRGVWEGPSCPRARAINCLIIRSSGFPVHCLPAAGVRSHVTHVLYSVDSTLHCLSEGEGVVYCLECMSCGRQYTLRQHDHSCGNTRCLTCPRLTQEDHIKISP